MKQLVVGMALAIVAGCGQTSQQLAPRVAPMPGDARRLLVAGNLAASDSALTVCSQAYQSAAEGAQCRYWLVLVRLDPAYPGSAGNAVTAARDFLTRDISAPGREEITLLLRVAAQRQALLASLDSSRAMLATRAAVAQTPLRNDSTAHEVEKLRTELARTQDELQRIKRRLSAPRP